ncbi:hypothetical protein [Burkholderia territorii]|uniref:hypothetical protein n=1 Tax=Burkholderia territorii TaxID=1503055 RepID=UPI000A4BA661|nr:hypothetical protein [Burkholderia territorii]
MSNPSPVDAASGPFHERAVTTTMRSTERAALEAVQPREGALDKPTILAEAAAVPGAMIGPYQHWR